MRLSSLCAAAVLCAATAALAAPPAAAVPEAAPPPVGLSEHMHPADKPQINYKIYIPAVHQKNDQRRFPLLIHQNPGGRTNIKPYTAWADQTPAIVVGIDGISNGMDQGKKNAVADAVLKDLSARGLWIHPTLRITIGMSGGSADGMRLVRRKPEGYAGCVFMGAGSIIAGDKAKGLAYAILGGAKDEWMPGDACYAMAEKAKEMGCPAIVHVQIDRQHREAPLEQQYEALTWILELQKLRMPTLPEAERAANLEAARKRMAQVGAIADPAARRKEAALLLSLPPLEKLDGYKAVGEAWASAVAAQAGATKDPIERHTFLMTAERNAPALTAEARQSVEKLAETLRQDPAVAKDWKLRSQFLDLEDAEIHCGLKADKLAEVLPKWETLAKEVAGTTFEPKVQHRIEVCKVLIETPSTIQKPTKIPAAKE